jgi:hypothetical protein
MYLDREQVIEGKDRFSVDDENEGSRGWRNNIRY